MEKFIADLIEQIGCRFDGELKTVEMYKNNELQHGISFVPKGSGDICCCPTCYVDELYQAFKNGKASMPDIIEHIINIVDRALGDSMPTNIELESLTNWEYVKDKVRPIVFGKENNKEMLEDYVTTDTKTDIAEAYEIVLGDDINKGRMSVKITKTHFEKWGIELSELKRVARANGMKEYTFKNMSQVVAEIMGVPVDELPTVDFPLWLLSNKIGVHGAGNMFNKRILNKIAEQLGVEQFYMLPSSMHEVLITNMETGPDELKQMVTCVNATEVPTQDILTNSVYLYDGNTVKVVA